MPRDLGQWAVIVDELRAWVRSPTACSPERARKMVDDAADDIEDLATQLDRARRRPAAGAHPFGPGAMVVSFNSPSDGSHNRLTIEGDGQNDPSVTLTIQPIGSKGVLSGDWLTVTVETERPADA